MLDEPHFGDYTRCGAREWDGSNWSSRAATGPGKRHRSAVVFDAAHQSLLLYGGGPEPDPVRLWEFACHVLAPDVDEDCDVDLFEFAAFQACFGPGRWSQACDRFDEDSTEDVALSDFRAFS